MPDHISRPETLGFSPGSGFIFVYRVHSRVSDICPPVSLFKNLETLLSNIVYSGRGKYLLNLFRSYVPFRIKNNQTGQNVHLEDNDHMLVGPDAYIHAHKGHPVARYRFLQFGFLENIVFLINHIL